LNRELYNEKIAFAMEKFSRYAGGAESYAVSLAITLIKTDGKYICSAKSGTVNRKKLSFTKYPYRNFFRRGLNCCYLRGNTKR